MESLITNISSNTIIVSIVLISNFLSFNNDILTQNSMLLSLPSIVRNVGYSSINNRIVISSIFPPNNISSRAIDILSLFSSI